jgi:hypothetical protein
MKYIGDIGLRLKQAMSSILRIKVRAVAGTVRPTLPRKRSRRIRASGIGAGHAEVAGLLSGASTRTPLAVVDLLGIAREGAPLKAVLFVRSESGLPVRLLTGIVAVANPFAATAEERRTGGTASRTFFSHLVEDTSKKEEGREHTHRPPH